MLVLDIIIAISGTGSALLAARVLLLMHRFTPRKIPNLSDNLDNLPTISVCVPARNETHAMTQCLERVIASSYPKLEIIVLDDSSVDNTSVLIKSFAHSGVRFVEGSPLPQDWLGKNYALEGLYKESSGEFILYIDVDTHIKPDTIDNIVSLALLERAEMVSTLPYRADGWRASVIFATLRHFWSVASHTKANPAAASSLWLVRRDFLKENFDGLIKLCQDITPERSVAKLAASSSQYRFFVSSPALGVSYEKKWSSQVETSKRLLYPFFGNNPILALGGLLAIGLALVPFAFLPTAIFIDWSNSHWLALAAVTLLISLYTIYTARVWRNGWWLGGLLLPIILLQEAFLLIESMYGYATGSILWKGRPIKRPLDRSSKN